jgi:hypothetical protein
MSSSVTIKGFDAIKRKVRLMADPNKLFDPDVQKVARKATREMALSTPKKIGNTRRGWQTPKKIKDSAYQVQNDIASGKWNIVRILDEGRGEVTPKVAKFLYIPLSKKGMRKKLGGKIGKDLVFGRDFVLSKRSKAVAGLGFIKRNNAILSRDLTRAIIARIRLTNG